MKKDARLIESFHSRNLGNHVDFYFRKMIFLFSRRVLYLSLVSLLEERTSEITRSVMIKLQVPVGAKQRELHLVG